MSGFKIITIKGIPIRINYTWFIILSLVVWTLAGGYFPMHSPGLSPFLLWPLALTAALLLFVSILLHELGHSFVALRHGIATHRGQVVNPTLAVHLGVREVPL